MLWVPGPHKCSSRPVGWVLTARSQPSPAPATGRRSFSKGGRCGGQRCATSTPGKKMSRGAEGPRHRQARLDSNKGQPGRPRPQSFRSGGLPAGCMTGAWCPSTPRPARRGRAQQWHRHRRAVRVGMWPCCLVFEKWAPSTPKLNSSCTGRCAVRRFPGVLGAMLQLTEDANTNPKKDQPHSMVTRQVWPAGLQRNRRDVYAPYTPVHRWMWCCGPIRPPLWLPQARAVHVGRLGRARGSPGGEIGPESWERAGRPHRAGAERHQAAIGTTTVMTDWGPLPALT